MNKEERGLYVCLEGLDGAGKSTVIEYLKKNFEEEDISFDVLAPTKALKVNEKNVLEVLYRNYKFLKRSRLFRAFLYADRSNSAAKIVNWDSDLIIGDRSVITSYVVYWSENPIFNKFKLFCVDCLEHKIKAPDYVIFIDVPYVLLDERLNKRNQERDMDETIERAKKMHNIYRMIREDNSINRIKGVKWLAVDGNAAKESVCEKVKEIIINILKERYS